MKKKNCGLSEEFKWLVSLLLQEIVRLILPVLKKGKSKRKRPNRSAARNKTK